MGWENFQYLQVVSSHTHTNSFSLSLIHLFFSFLLFPSIFHLTRYFAFYFPSLSQPSFLFLSLFSSLSFGNLERCISLFDRLSFLLFYFFLFSLFFSFFFLCFLGATDWLCSSSERHFCLQRRADCSCHAPLWHPASAAQGEAIDGSQQRVKRRRRRRRRESGCGVSCLFSFLLHE
jgi:hypothetical protein